MSNGIKRQRKVGVVLIRIVPLNFKVHCRIYERTTFVAHGIDITYI